MRTTLEVGHLVTAEEFARLQDSDHRWELVDGRVIKMSPPGARHGVIAARLAECLNHHARTNGLGVVLVAGGYRLASNPDTVRGPDLSFVRRGRIAGAGIPVGFWPGAPDLVVESVSPDNRQAEIRTKVDQYLLLGTQLVWVVEPDDKCVAVHDAPGSTRILRTGDTLDGGFVLAGFRCEVEAIFAGL
jgi:Uma2 family endonuclease